MEFNSDSDKIVLEGPPTEVQQAKESFESFTEDLVYTLYMNINCTRRSLRMAFFLALSRWQLWTLLRFTWNRSTIVMSSARAELAVRVYAVNGCSGGKQMSMYSIPPFPHSPIPHSTFPSESHQD